MAYRFSDLDFPLPVPAYCAACRHQRRLAFRNELNLYSRTSSVTGMRILSLYHPRPLWGAPYQVMIEDEWRADNFNPYAYGRAVDFAAPFFEQYAELHKAVPRMSIVNLQNENSPYTSQTGYSRNCYLLPCSEDCEDCYYGRFLQKCKNCVDCTTAHRCEWCYESFQIEDCCRCAFLSLSQNCHECYFSENLVGCKYCLFCANLRQAEYCVFDNPVSPDQFRTEVRRLLSSGDTVTHARERWLALRLKRSHRPTNMRNCEECEGDFLLDSKNCIGCLDTTECEDCADLITAYKARDCRSCSNIYLECELDYEMSGCTQIYHCAFGTYVFRSRDVLYSEYIYDSAQIFGCVGITRGENSILNVRYSATDYQSLAKRLVLHMRETGEWGKPLPPHFSPFGYNETVASDLFPLSKEEACTRGFLWRDADEHSQVEPTQSATPNTLDDCNEVTSKEVYVCQASGESFKLIAPELAFLREMGIAPPRCAPRTRHRRREGLRFPSALRTAACRSCNEKVITNIPKEIEGTLRCERCYHTEIYGV